MQEGGGGDFIVTSHHNRLLQHLLTRASLIVFVSVCLHA